VLLEAVHGVDVLGLPPQLWPASLATAPAARPAFVPPQTSSFTSQAVAARAPGAVFTAMLRLAGHSAGRPVSVHKCKWAAPATTDSGARPQAVPYICILRSAGAARRNQKLSMRSNAGVRRGVSM
jgi:hypothetical protein